MPLQYVIDAYNIINHNTFTPIRKKIKDPQRALLEFIKNRIWGKNPKSKITVVFDGYPKVSAQNLEEAGIDVVFSREETADARIKMMVETSKNPKDIVVVSDDREIIFFIKSVGASAIGVEEFIIPEENPQRKKEDPIKPELNYSQISKINEELKALWVDRGR
ncbi:MAG: NYN domain-containing protein [Candidatus Omnitrophota bacterium]|nr:NYN domain-containing protein [Candidatus Omnitrophota bacterium]